MATGGDKSGERGGENRRLKYCPYCDVEVPKTTYYRHRDKYFDVVKKVCQTSSRVMYTPGLPCVQCF